MDAVHIDLTGVRQVGLRFDVFPDALYEDLKGEIDGLTRELFALIQAATPSKTGELRSQERVRLFTDETRITGYVDIAGTSGSDYAKAGALEYGSTGNPYQRAQHFATLDHLWGDKLNEPITVLVKAFSAPGHIAEHAFERGPLAAMQPQVLARLNAAVDKAVQQANA